MTYPICPRDPKAVSHANAHPTAVCKHYDHGECHAGRKHLEAHHRDCLDRLRRRS
jgi:hypothetical protein